MISDLDRYKRLIADRQSQLDIAKEQLVRVMEHNNQLLKENEYLVRLMREHAFGKKGVESSDKSKVIEYFTGMSTERNYKQSSEK